MYKISIKGNNLDYYDEMRDWCKNNFEYSSNWFSLRGLSWAGFEFENEEEAMAFKLRWL